MYNNLKVKVMKAKEIKLISDAAIAKLSDGISSALSDMREELGDARWKSELYAQLLALSAIYCTEFMNRERNNSESTVLT